MRQGRLLCNRKLRSYYINPPGGDAYSHEEVICCRQSCSAREYAKAHSILFYMKEFFHLSENDLHESGSGFNTCPCHMRCDEEVRIIL